MFPCSRDGAGRDGVDRVSHSWPPLLQNGERNAANAGEEKHGQDFPPSNLSSLPLEVLLTAPL